MLLLSRHSKRVTLGAVVFILLGLAAVPELQVHNTQAFRESVRHLRRLSNPSELLLSARATFQTPRTHRLDLAASKAAARASILPLDVRAAVLASLAAGDEGAALPIDWEEDEEEAPLTTDWRPPEYYEEEAPVTIDWHPPQYMLEEAHQSVTLTIPVKRL